MKEIIATSKISVFEDIKELTDTEQDLMLRAIEVRKNAYAPYSKFRVGAAILLDNGEIVVGSNQENAAYPSGLCAERVAVFYAGAIFPKAKILKMAITAASDLKKTITAVPPCGACRQSIAEYEVKQNTPIAIFFMGESGPIHHSTSLKNLLPFMFETNLL
ncbi:MULTISPECIES: cytidine deaminase [Flavobacterium]|uniref:cytidine deaminase n=1 Tax=Flavobacterium TaxID=237 RepID=UPI0022AC2DAB|nr:MULTISPECIES: cytidine deaminase [Flavobacterium]